MSFLERGLEVCQMILLIRIRNELFPNSLLCIDLVLNIPFLVYIIPTLSAFPFSVVS